MRYLSFQTAVSLECVATGAQVFRCCPEQDDRATFVPEPLRSNKSRLLNDTNHADDWSRVDAATIGLVVEAHVAASHRSTKGLTGLHHPVYGLTELPHDFGPFRRS